MSIMIIATILWVGLITSSILKNQHKILIMTILASFLVLTNFVNELYNQFSNRYPQTKFKTYQTLQFSTQLYKNAQNKNFIQEEQNFLTFLLKKIKNNENLLIYLKNINVVRFKTIYSKLQSQNQIMSANINFEEIQCPYRCLQKSINKYNHQMVFLVIQKISKSQNLHNIEKLYENYNISVIFLSLPQSFSRSRLAKWTQIYKFQGNYVQALLDKQPSKLVQLCQKYRTIDYNFYLMSQSNSLSDLCTNLPTNKVTECIRQFLTNFNDKVPYLKVKHCLKGQIQQGVEIQNGMVGVKKQYYYSGKIDKNIFKDFKEEEM